MSLTVVQNWVRWVELRLGRGSARATGWRQRRTSNVEVDKIGAREARLRRKDAVASRSCGGRATKEEKRRRKEVEER